MREIGAGLAAASSILMFEAPVLEARYFAPDLHCTHCSTKKTGRPRGKFPSASRCGGRPPYSPFTHPPKWYIMPN